MELESGVIPNPIVDLSNYTIQFVTKDWKESGDCSVGLKVHDKTKLIWAEWLIIDKYFDNLCESFLLDRFISAVIRKEI